MIYIVSDIRTHALIRYYYKPLIDIFGFHLIVYDTNKLNKLIELNTEDCYIFYRTVPDEYAKSATISRICVLDPDPSQSNTANFPDLGIPVIGYADIPYQFVQTEDSYLSALLAEPKIYDIMIIETIIGEPAKSTMNKIRSELITRGYTVLLMTSNTKDADIARSKIILNLSDTISALCDRWCLAGHLIISKKLYNKPRSDINDPIMDLIMFEPPNTIVSKCISILTNYDEYADRQRRILLHGNSTLNRKKHIIDTRRVALEKFVDFANSFVRTVRAVRAVETIIEPDVEPVKSIEPVSESDVVQSVEQQLYYSIQSDGGAQFVLICSDKIGSISSNLVSILQSMNFTAIVREALTPYDKDNNTCVYILIHDSAKYEYLPKRYIFYQIEQTNSPWFTDRYIEALNRSIMIWEYAIPNTVRYATKQNTKKIYYMPMPFYRDANYTSQTDYVNCTFDILFYGQMSERRDRILCRLSESYNIKIACRVFGEELQDLIRRSKIVINIHFYDEPTLETARLNEVLIHNKLIISEKTVHGDWYNMGLYKDCVVFVEPIHDNLDNMQQLYDEIDKLLDPTAYVAKIRDVTNAIPVIQQTSIFHTHKILTAMGLISNSAIHNLPNTGDIICLHLLETPFRMAAFADQPYMPNTRIQIYPAIKHDTRWVGCGMSYQNIMLNAKRTNLPSITVCEDDCMFREGFDEKYAIIKSFLELYERWDIFVGCVAALPEDTEFSNIVVYEGMVFIEINKMHSMVFNIYNSSSYDTICGWDSSNRDALTNTIDQYIKNKKLRIIISYPFEFACLNTRSTIWEHETVLAYQSMFKQSLELISKKITLYTSNIINTSCIKRITYGTTEAESIDVTQQMLGYVSEHPLLTERFDMIRVLGDPYPGSTKTLYVYADKTYRLGKTFALFVSTHYNTAESYNFKKAVRLCKKFLLKP